MKTIYTTEIFDGWLDSLRDKQVARRIQARITVRKKEISVTTSLWVKAFPKCGFITVQAFESISR
ncbi:hypothetical protein [Limnohabitans sp.]